MPKPAYPADWASTVRGMQQNIRRAYTAAQTRVRYAAIRAASIIIGEDAGNTIVIDPDIEGTRPRIVMDAGGTGTARVAAGTTDGGENAIESRAYNTADGSAAMQVAPRSVGMWVWHADTSVPGAYHTTVQIDENGAVVRFNRPGSTQQRARVELYDEGAWIGAYNDSGQLVSYLWCRPDGTIRYKGAFVQDTAAAAEGPPT